MNAVSGSSRGYEPLERQYLAWESVLTLIRSLGASLDLDHVTTLSLVTVTQHISVEKAAVYLTQKDEDTLVLCQSLGIRRPRLQHKHLAVSPKLDEVLRESGGVVRLRAAYGMSPDLLATFHYACYLSDGTDFVGLLLLGPVIGGRAFDEQDRRLLHTMGVVIGMTVKKAMLHEQMAGALQRMEEAENLRKAILDHVSHEFNTPLLVVKQSSEMVQDTEDPEQRGELWNMHGEAVERLEQLVQAVTLVAESDRVDPSAGQWLPEPDFVASTLVPTVDRANSRGIEATLHGGDEDDVEIFCSEVMLARALDRLVDNAWTFRDDGESWIVVNAYATARGWWLQQDHASRIELYSGYLSAGMKLESGQILFSDGRSPDSLEDAHDVEFVVEVLDGGIGIPEDEVSKVFEPFRQATNSPNLGVRGAGMGLTAARKLLRDLGGDVQAQSSIGKGSAFAILVPARIAPKAS